jgi:hypothetical protein
MVIKKDKIEAGTVVQCIEQRMAAGNDFSGEDPSLSSAAFVPYFDTIDNVARWGSDATTPVYEGDKGGLFAWDMIGPSSVEYIAANFGGSVDWTLSIVLRTGEEVVFATGTGQYILRREYDRFYMFPGDKIKVVTSSGAAAMVVRVGVTLSTGIH